MRGPGRKAWVVMGGELLIVVVGVLIALAADSWRQERQDQARALSYVQALASELTTARAELLDAVNETEAMRDSASSFYQGLRQDPGSPDDRRLGDLYWPELPVVPTGTIDALLLSGDINLLPDPEARSVLINERSAIEMQVATLDRLYEVASFNIPRFLLEVAVLRKEVGLPPGAAVPFSVARRSPDIEAALQLHRGMTVNRLNALRRILESVDALGVATRDLLAEPR